MFSRDEMQRAIEDALKSMEGIALELYRRGREEAREELEEARARNADMRAMLEQVTRERDEARAERDAAIARITEVGVMVATNGNRLAKDAYRRGAEAMREACANAMHPIMRSMISRTEAAQTIRALPIPEEP